jgi:RNase H-fold protein (predicted Holliday junction resolvase)
MLEKILSIDPGKDKTGLAVIDSSKVILERKVIPSLNIASEVTDIYYRHEIGLVVIGNGGPARMTEKKISNLNIKCGIIFVNEKGSTLEARKLFWKDNKKVWFLRWVPSSFLLPPKPYDDYAAAVIGLRYLGGAPQQ